MKRIFLTPIILFFYTLSFSQDCSNVCGFINSDITKDSVYNLIYKTGLNEISSVGQRVVDQLLCIDKLDGTNFIAKASSVKNAHAIECDGVKYILYNPDDIIEVSDGITPVAYGILAHEVAHHIRGDAWLGNSTSDRHKAELAADEYAAYLLGRLGIGMDTTLMMLNNVDEEETVTHPSKKDRILAVKTGWKKGREKIIAQNLRAYILACNSNEESPKYQLSYKYENKLFSKKKKVYVSIVPYGNGKMSEVKEVRYYLHPTTFSKNVIIKKNKKKNFKMTLSLIGEFELRASVITESGTEYLVIQNLEVFNKKRSKGEFDY